MKPKERKKAIELIVKHNYNQKEAAEAVGVQAKTIGIWMKAYKEKNRLINKNIDKLNERLEAMLADPETSSTDIHKITTSIAAMQNSLRI